MNFSFVGERRLFTERRRQLMEDRGEARGPELLCNRCDAKWSAVWRGHLRPAHLDNELRCNSKLRWTAVYPLRSPSLPLSHQSPLSLHTSLSLVIEPIFSPQPDLVHPLVDCNEVFHSSAYALLKYSHFMVQQNMMSDDGFGYPAVCKAPTLPAATSKLCIYLCIIMICMWFKMGDSALWALLKF